MSNLLKHAINEFIAAGWVEAEGKPWKDSMQEAICKDVYELLAVFSAQGHSGSSAPYAIQMFSKLAAFEPITPLTGDDSEWVEVSNGVYQNKRNSAVFKDKTQFDGQAYFLDAIVWWEWYTDKETGEKSKIYFTNKYSRQTVKFPCIPKTKHKEWKGESSA